MKDKQQKNTFEEEIRDILSPSVRNGFEVSIPNVSEEHIQKILKAHKASLQEIKRKVEEHIRYLDHVNLSHPQTRYEEGLRDGKDLALKTLNQILDEMGGEENEKDT